MTRKQTVKLTRFEMEIMDALWDLSSASTRESREKLPERKRPTYTTVQTIIRRLEEKGAVRQTRQIGNAHVFEPVVTRNAAHRRLIDELLDLFGGSARPWPIISGRRLSLHWSPGWPCCCSDAQLRALVISSG